MNEIINIKINGNTMTKDYSTAGVAGDANNMKLRIEFAENWDGFTKTIRFWNANGEDPVDIILGVNLLEDILTSSRVYITPIPGEAMTEAGTCTFSVRGYKDGVLKCSVDGELNVMPSMRTSDVNEPADVTPTQAEQLQAEIEGILPDITAIMQEAKAAEENAETSAENAATQSASAENAAEEAKKYANDSETNLSGSLNAAKRAENAAESAESSANEAKETGEKAADELQKMIDIFKLTGGGKGVPVISVHDELYAEIVPEEGQVYVVMFDNVEASDNHVAPDENGDYPVVVTDTVRYRVKIGDGKTKLADLPIVSSNLQAGDGNGSIVQIDPTYDNGDDCYCAPSIATGQLSAAFGKYHKVHGKTSVAFNYNNEITEKGIRSFVANMGNLIDAARAFATGYKNTVRGVGGGIYGGTSNTIEANAKNPSHSHTGTIVGGVGNKLLGNAIRAILVGNYLSSDTAEQVILGRYNAEDPDAVLIVGCGTSDTERKNALVVKNDGTVLIDGKEIPAGQIEINIPEGASVVCTDGYIELAGKQNDNGNFVFNVPYGMWSIKATINGREYVTSVAVNGEEIPVMYFDEVLDNFADNTIDGIITACRTNTIPDTWLIGDKKTFTMDDKEYHLVIIGKNVDTFTNGKTAPLTFQFEEIYITCYMYSSSDTPEVPAWDGSRVRTYCQSFAKKLPDVLKNVIAPVVKETKLLDGTIQITEDVAFVPSYEEMTEGGMYYEYFESAENRIKTLDGAKKVWWTRSPSSDTHYWTLTTAGAFDDDNGYYKSTKRGISPAFCLAAGEDFTSAIKVGDTVLTEEELSAIKASAGTADLSGFATKEELTAEIGGAIAKLTAEDIGASPSGHTHTASEVGASPSGHTHDDRYYTEAEMDTKLAGKAASSHTQAASTITAGTFSATGVKAKSGTDYSTARVRNISAGTADLEAGVSALESGSLYFVYE